MHWIAPSEKDTGSAALETRLWAAAARFRANSSLKSQEYTGAICGPLTTLLQQNPNLRRTRDLLLPRLLSGQMDLGEN